jgi:hypothetical protein
LASQATDGRDVVLAGHSGAIALPLVAASRPVSSSSSSMVCCRTSAVKFWSSYLLIVSMDAGGSQRAQFAGGAQRRRLTARSSRRSCWSRPRQRGRPLRQLAAGRVLAVPPLVVYSDEGPTASSAPFVLAAHAPNDADAEDPAHLPASVRSQPAPGATSKPGQRRRPPPVRPLR